VQLVERSEFSGGPAAAVQSRRGAAAAERRAVLAFSPEWGEDGPVLPVANIL